jgi:hypothetical protein
MSRAEPPPLASWMLIHLTPLDQDQALAGDLIEEFRAGRSTGWYWRQVLAAMGIGWFQSLVDHRFQLLFASVWSLLAPAWLLVIAEIEQEAHFLQTFASMNWPWSILSELGFTLGTSLVFLWIGILLSLLPDLWLEGNLRPRACLRGVKSSLSAVVFLWAALIALPRYFVGQHPNQTPTGAETEVTRTLAPHETLAFKTEIEPEAFLRRDGTETSHSAFSTLHLQQAMTDLSRAALLVRLPFFVFMLWTLSSEARRVRAGRRQTTV